MLSDADLLAEIHAAYPDDTVASVLAGPEMFTDRPDGSLLDREAESEAEMTAVATGLLDADDEAFEVRAARALLVKASLAVLLSGGQPATLDDDPGLFVAPGSWPVESCFDVAALGAATREAGR